MNSTVKFMFLLAISILSNCAPPYTAVKPDGFAEYPENREFRAVSPEGVVYRIRHEKNKPYAEFSFWCEAFEKRMVDAGYRFISDTVDNESQRAVYEFAAPVGHKDYVYLVGLIPMKKEIVLIEAAGDAVQFQQYRDAVFKAINQVKPR